MAPAKKNIKIIKKRMSTAVENFPSIAQAQSLVSDTDFRGNDVQLELRAEARVYRYQAL